MEQEQTQIAFYTGITLTTVTSLYLLFLPDSGIKPLSFTLAVFLFACLCYPKCKLPNSDKKLIAIFGTIASIFCHFIGTAFLSLTN